MLYNAKDLRAMSRGRAEVEQEVRYALEDLNQSLKNAAILGESAVAVELRFTPAHLKPALSEILGRLGAQGFNVLTKTGIVHHNGTQSVKLQVSW